jgi:hypothetical protein
MTMLSYKAFLAESKDVVSHLEHAEDFVLNDGVDGTRQVINYMRNVRDTLAGKVKGKINNKAKVKGRVKASNNSNNRGRGKGKVNAVLIVDMSHKVTGKVKHLTPMIFGIRLLMLKVK